jgi:hypothetical protein
MHEIIKDDNGLSHATDGTVSVSLLDPNGRMFKRRAIKGVGTSDSREITWLVAELDGVRLYQHGNQIVMTKQDMYP